jgi:hypothetical protein
MQRPALFTGFLLILLLATAGCGQVEPSPPGSLAEAKSQAAARGVPILLDFFTEW